MTYDDLTLALVTSGVANAVMVGLLAGACVVIWRQRRKGRRQTDAAIQQTLELGAVRDELDKATVDNDRLTVEKDRLTVVSRRLGDRLNGLIGQIEQMGDDPDEPTTGATEELGRLLRASDDVWAANERLMAEWTEEAS